MIYLDNAATTFPKPSAVYDKVYEVMRDYGANPGRSGHDLALKASREIFDTRDLLAKFFNVDNPFNIIFTFNATESLNIAIKGVLKPGDHVITTSMEHNSVLRPIKFLEKFEVENTIVWADDKGRVKAEDIEKEIKDNTKLIVTTHISNLTGTIMPIKEIGNIAKKHGVLYLLDAAQSAGVYGIDLKDNNVDLMAFPGHKGLLGPQGTGGLYIREGIVLDELMQGGTGSASQSLIQPDLMPDKFESGTPNAPGIIGLGEGIKYINNRGIDNIKRLEERLLTKLIDGIKDIPNITMYGPLNINEQAGVLSINYKGVDSSTIAYVLNEEFGICVRPGLHCAPLAHETLGTLNQGAVRISIGPFNTDNDIEELILALEKISKEF